MEEFLIYLLKSSGVLALFWCCFKLFLEKETFSRLHRIFLLSGLFAALFFPLWILTKTVFIDPLPLALTEPTAMGSAPDPVFTIDGWTVIAIIYALGSFFFLGRFVLQLFSLRRLLKKSTARRCGSFIYMETREETSPFSFFHIIVYNPGLHNRVELETILEHEKIHSLQWHSLDILLIHLFAAFQWMNPFVWWYQKTLSQNLEYIADQEVAKNMGNPKEYQYLLLKNASTSLQHSSIINPIFNSLIKKRIVMLNKNRSNKSKTWKFSLVIPFLAFFLVAFNTKTVTQVHPQTTEQSPALANGEADSKRITYAINKNSTAADLEYITGMLKNEYNILQSFSDIERDQSGALIKISSSFTVSNADKSITTGTNTFNDLNGIKPFSIYVETDKDKKIISMGHETMEKNNMKGLNIVGPTNPLYIVDGVEHKGAKAPDLDPAGIESINVLKGPKAISKYGEKGKNGAIEITTKKNNETNSPNKTLQIKKVDPNGTDPNAKEKNPSTITIEGYKASGPGSANSINNSQPLIIIDGVEKEAGFKINSVPTDDIENINVYKDENATQKFGAKGKNGVIEITTKKD